MSKDKKIKVGGMGQLIVDINNKRCDSCVYINQDIDVTNLVKYIEKNKKNGNDITYFHAFITALAKTIYNRPKLNYYILNRHVYEHSDIVISFAAKVSFDDKSEEVMILVPFKEKDNIFTIRDYVKKELDKYRNKLSNKDTNKKGANSAIEIVGKLPNIIRIPVVGILKLMDSKGCLPSGLKEDNLYYSSVIVSNLGSIKCGAIYHHLSEFGTCSGVMTIGEIKEKEVIIDGKKEIRKFCEFGINLDERIADGYYFIKSVKLMEEIINNPRSLEDSVFTKIEAKETR